MKKKAGGVKVAKRGISTCVQLRSKGVDSIGSREGLDQRDPQCVGVVQNLTPIRSQIHEFTSS